MLLFRFSLASFRLSFVGSKAPIDKETHPWRRSERQNTPSSVKGGSPNKKLRRYGGPTWMSEELSKMLVSGVFHLYLNMGL